jgi:hypothetical protein
MMAPAAPKQEPEPMPTNYHGLPAPLQQEPDEPRAHFAARLFCAVLRDAGAVITMADDDLELAAYGARTATDARDMSPQYYDATADAARLIAGAIRRRAAYRANVAEPVTIQPAPLGRPHGPAVPVHPYPSTQPPAGTHADDRPHPARPLTRAGDTIRF